MKIVKWITDNEIEITVESDSELETLKRESVKVFKRPINGSRRSEGSYFIRYQVDTVYSVGAYDFPSNPELEKLCLLLNRLGFVFWGNFKTEISPFDYMNNLQDRGILMESFMNIQAGESIAKESAYRSA